MAQIRTFEYIPISENGPLMRPDWLEGSYGYACDVFYDPEHYDESNAKVIFHFTGAGVYGRYSETHRGVSELTSRGFRVYVVYYYQRGFDLEDIPVEYRDKVKIPWREDWGSGHLNYGLHLIARSTMVQSALDHVGDKYLSTLPSSAKVYLSGKSRGGATLIAWLSTHTIYNKNFPQDIRLAVILQGYVGSATGGFLNYYKTKSVLAQYMTFTDIGIKTVYNYNDGDYGYDLVQDFTNSIPYNRLRHQYFINEPTKGHQTNWELLATLVQQDSINAPLSWANVELKSVLEIMNERVIEKNSWPNGAYNA